MNRAKVLLALPVYLLILTAGGGFLTGSFAQAQNVQHLNVTQPGGMPGIPVMNGIEKKTNGIVVHWDGPPGYYQLFEKSSVNSNIAWQAVGAFNMNRNATIPSTASNVFFRVQGPAPSYAGSVYCVDCHPNIFNSGTNTHHAKAFSDPAFQLAGGQTNSACLSCHTVGYRLPSGFINATATPDLAGVQCENCHGSAGNHISNENDVSARPRVEVAATVCGGCHTGPKTPNYDEWKTSGHAGVVEDMSLASRVSSCGRCHSGTGRLALLNGSSIMAVTNDANVGIVCVTCHDPHQTNGHPAQLRNPVFSTNDYFLTTSEVFSNKYNPNINICAQCHNHRGASWSSTNRPPHHSPQYNMMIGTVGELSTGTATNQIGVHAMVITNQCAGCHMQKTPHVAGPPEVAAVTGHKFKMDSYVACQSCHFTNSTDLNLSTNFARAWMFGILKIEGKDFIFPGFGISNQVQEVKVLLDNWGTTKAPAALRAKYGARAWEYIAAGSLSTPPGGSAKGPDAVEQALIPDNIKKARHNLYLVLYDGSYGIHNYGHTFNLLEAAYNWVQAELIK